MTDTQPDWTPDFPGQRPPFAPGNDLAVKHGARSEVQIQPRARQIIAELESSGVLPDYLADQSYRPALVSYARAEAVCELLSDYIATLAIETATGGVLPIFEQYRRWVSTAQSLRRSLGLDPMSRAALTRDVVSARANASVAVAEIAAAGRRAAGDQ